MYNRFFLSFFSFSLLISAAHAGRGTLILEADLSDEQQAAVKKAFVDPYIQDTTYKISRHTTPPTSAIGTKRFCHSELPNMSFPYPPLQALKRMVYRTPLISQIDEADAEMLVENYKKMPAVVGLDKINVFCSRPVVHNHQEFYSKITLLTHSPLLERLNKEVSRACSQDKEYKLSSWSTLIFSKTFLSRRGDDRWALEREAMERRMAVLSSKENSLSLTFKNFNLKYIDDEENVIYIWPLNLQ